MNGRVAVEQHGTIRLRGKKLPVSTFRVTEILDPFRDEMLAENRRIIESIATEAA
jgi:class 3 adenylate cyclase